jgi:hypothetical protein
MTSHTHDLPQTIILTGGTSGVGYAGARTIAASHSERKRAAPPSLTLHSPNLS